MITTTPETTTTTPETTTTTPETTTTTPETTTVSAAADGPCAPAERELVEVVSGPHTIVALGEDCLVCEEALEPGQVYVFCRDQTRAGVAHEESCTDQPGGR